MGVLVYESVRNIAQAITWTSAANVTFRVREILVLYTNFDANNFFF